MSKYKEETTNIKIRSQGWTKNNAGKKYYCKDNWVIMYHKDFGIDYWIIDESYGTGCTGCYLTGDKQDFLEELHMLKVKKTPVWRALHGEYDE